MSKTETHQEASMSSQFKTNGASISPASASAIARAITAQVRASRTFVQDAVGTLEVGGVVTFPTKNVADAGGKTTIFVQRIS